MDLLSPLPPLPAPGGSLLERARSGRLGFPTPPAAPRDFRGVLQEALSLPPESPAARAARRVAERRGLPASGNPEAPAADRERFRLRQAAGDFESILVTMLLQKMRATIQKSELFHGGKGEEVFQDLLDRTVAEGAMKGRGLGIGQMLYDQMSQYLATAATPGESAVDGDQDGASESR